MKMRYLVALAAVAFGPALAAAQDLNYTYAELDYVNAELDDPDVDGDGLRVHGSYAVTDIVHVFASYEDIGFDFDVDTTELAIGAGLNWSLSPRADFVGTLGYINAEVEVPGADADDDGFLLGAGIRGRLPTQPIEIEGHLRYVDLQDFGSDTSFIAEGRYFFTDMFSVGLGVEFDDDVTIWNVGFRAQFAGL